MRRRTQLAFAGLVAGLAAVALAVGIAWWRGAPNGGPEEPAPVSAQPRSPAGAPAPDAVPPAAEAPEEEGAAPGELAGLEAVDLEEVRRALPHNGYWENSAPTENVRTIQQREEDEAHWNVEYGKVLSGTGSEQEIDAYFAHRQRVSADAVEFTGYLLDHYGEHLSERDTALLELARSLHLARLQELPRKIEEARERKRQQDAARAAWLADERAFDEGAAR
jgi:hypothetical protein